jgi:hypothetical protein
MKSSLASPPPSKRHLSLLSALRREMRTKNRQSRSTTSHRFPAPPTLIARVNGPKCSGAPHSTPARRVPQQPHRLLVIDSPHPGTSTRDITGAAQSELHGSIVRDPSRGSRRDQRRRTEPPTAEPPNHGATEPPNCGHARRDRPAPHWASQTISNRTGRRRCESFRKSATMGSRARRSREQRRRLRRARAGRTTQVVRKVSDLSEQAPQPNWPPDVRTIRGVRSASASHQSATPAERRRRSSTKSATTVASRACPPGVRRIAMSPAVPSSRAHCRRSFHKVGDDCRKQSGRTPAGVFAESRCAPPCHPAERIAAGPSTKSATTVASRACPPEVRRIAMSPAEHARAERVAAGVPQSRRRPYKQSAHPPDSSPNRDVPRRRPAERTS